VGKSEHFGAGGERHQGEEGPITAHQRDEADDVSPDRLGCCRSMNGLRALVIGLVAVLV